MSASLFGRVSAAGVLSNSSGISMASRLGTGRYQIVMSQAQSSPDYSVVPLFDDFVGGSPPYSEVDTRTNSSFIVEWRNSSDALVDQEFTFTVYSSEITQGTPGRDGSDADVTSDNIIRAVAGSPTDDQIIQYDAASRRLEFQDPPEGGSGGSGVGVTPVPYVTGDPHYWINTGDARTLNFIIHDVDITDTNRETDNLLFNLAGNPFTINWNIATAPRRISIAINAIQARNITNNARDGEVRLQIELKNGSTVLQNFTGSLPVIVPSKAIALIEDIPEAEGLPTSLNQVVTITALSGEQSVVSDGTLTLTAGSVSSGPWAELGSGDDAGKIKFLINTVLRLSIGITCRVGTANARACPELGVSGTGIQVLSKSNPYYRATNTNEQIFRYVDLLVTKDSIGTVSILNPSVTFSNTTLLVSTLSHMVIIPQGGSKGEKGDSVTGARGPAGRDSTVPGPAGRDGRDGSDASVTSDNIIRAVQGTPSDNQIIQFDSATSRLEFQDPPAGGGGTASVTSDAIVRAVSGTPTDDQIIQFDSSSGQLEFQDPPRDGSDATVTSANIIRAVSGTPSDDQIIQFDAANSRLEFVDPPSGGGGSSITPVPYVTGDPHYWVNTGDARTVTLIIHDVDITDRNRNTNQLLISIEGVPFTVNWPIATAPRRISIAVSSIQATNITNNARSGMVPIGVSLRQGTTTLQSIQIVNFPVIVPGKEIALKEDISSGGGGGGATPFADVQLVPPGIGSITANRFTDDFPSSIDLVLSEKLTSKTVQSVTFQTVGSVTATLSNKTPISSNLGETSGVLRFDFTLAQKKLILAELTDDTEKMDCTVTITFTDSSTYIYNIPFVVNNRHYSINDSNINELLGVRIVPRNTIIDGKVIYGPQILNEVSVTGSNPFFVGRSDLSSIRWAGTLWGFASWRRTPEGGGRVLASTGMANILPVQGEQTPNAFTAQYTAVCFSNNANSGSSDTRIGLIPSSSLSTSENRGYTVQFFFTNGVVNTTYLGTDYNTGDVTDIDGRVPIGGNIRSTSWWFYILHNNVIRAFTWNTRNYAVSRRSAGDIVLPTQDQRLDDGIQSQPKYNKFSCDIERDGFWVADNSGNAKIIFMNNDGTQNKDLTIDIGGRPNGLKLLPHGAKSTTGLIHSVTSVDGNVWCALDLGSTALTISSRATLTLYGIQPGVVRQLGLGDGTKLNF